MAVIELKNLSCGYGSKVVVKDFNARIESGEIFCLLGPNGIGKTTLFKTVLGMLHPLRGEILMNGQDTRTLGTRERAGLIAYVPQSSIQPFSFVVEDVVVMGRVAMHGVFGKPGKEDREKALTVMERLGIEHLAPRIFPELSGGERQMVLIARALAQEPAFLMMDEPTSNLDFGNQAVVLESIVRLNNEGLGIIMTTHHPEHVLRCGGRVALMKRDGYVTGISREIITEENMQATYGIPVAVTDLNYRDERLYLCQPMPRDEYTRAASADK